MQAALTVGALLACGRGWPPALPFGVVGRGVSADVHGGGKQQRGQRGGIEILHVYR